MEENQLPRKRFTIGQIKKALTLWDTKYANDRNGLIAALKREHGIKVSTSTLTDWKKRKLEYLACPADDLKALRKAKHPGMETELARHIERSNKAGLPVTSQQACIRALSFVKDSDPASTFKASPGWLYRAKRRLGVRSYRPRGEAASADANGVRIAQEGMPELLAELGCSRARDFYNCYETGMYP